MNKFSLFLCTIALVTTLVAKLPVQQVQADIFYEIAHGNTKSIKAWLKSKPDLSVRNQEGQTVLSFAALTGQRDLVKIFVKAGALINAVDNSGKTALDHAVEFGQVKMICDLVKNGGKVTNSANLYHLKSVMKDRAFSLFVRFAALFVFGSIVTALLFVPVLLPVIMFDVFAGASGIPWSVSVAYGISTLVVAAYTWSLPFRVYSWNNASNRNWMLATGTISLN